MPASFFEQFEPAEQLPIAKHPLIPVGMPPIAYHHGQWEPYTYAGAVIGTEKGKAEHQVCALTEGGGSSACWPSPRTSAVNKTLAHHARLGYYAATSFADSLVGRVLDEVKALGMWQQTVVSLTSDHGEWAPSDHSCPDRYDF